MYSPKRQARIAGALYVLVIAAGMFAEIFIRPRVFVPGDAAATAQNLVAHAGLYRFGLLTDLITVVAAIIEGVLVYRLFKPINPALALVSLAIALVSNAGEVLSALIHLAPLIILADGRTAGALSPAQLQDFAAMAMRTHEGSLTITLFIFSFALLIDGYLIWRSTFWPRAVGLLLGLAGVCYLVNSVALLAAVSLPPPLDAFILLPSFIGESAFALWLLVRGVDEDRWRAVDLASRRGGS